MSSGAVVGVDSVLVLTLPQLPLLLLPPLLLLLSLALTLPR